MQSRVKVLVTSDFQFFKFLFLGIILVPDNSWKATYKLCEWLWALRDPLTNDNYYFHSCLDVISFSEVSLLLSGISLYSFFLYLFFVILPSLFPPHSYHWKINPGLVPPFIFYSKGSLSGGTLLSQPGLRSENILSSNFLDICNRSVRECIIAGCVACAVQESMAIHRGE